jgi:predicted ATPase
MSIQSLSVKNFRSLKAVQDWRPGLLNLLIGPNASGKSNVLRAIDLLAASAQGRLAKWVQRAGGMEPLLWDGQGEICSIDFARNTDWDPFAYGISLERVGMTGDFQVCKESLSSPTTLLFDREGDQADIYNFEAAQAERQGRLQIRESLLSLLKPPFFNEEFISEVGTEIAGFSVYHDFHTNRDAAIRQAAVTRHETRVDADGQNLISVLHTLYTGNRDFKNTVNDAMTAAFGSDFEELVFPPASDNRIQLRLRWRSLKREQSAADLSDGTLRFLFLMTVLASPDPAPLIAIDEPETGLHPSMLPIIAEHAVDASKKAQIIFTTHSPQMLDAFSSETRPQTTVVKREDGETKLHVLDDAKLSHWLEEYSLGALHRSGELEEMAA